MDNSVPDFQIQRETERFGLRLVTIPGNGRVVDPALKPLRPGPPIGSDKLRMMNQTQAPNIVPYNNSDRYPIRGNPYTQARRYMRRVSCFPSPPRPSSSRMDWLVELAR